MKKFKMKQLALAVGAVLGSAAMIPQAQAVHLATDGLGQVLIFPYYTARAGWNTLLNVTNTSDQTVIAKVRFKEAYNSRDVFDFNIILSPYDVWTGWVDGTNSGPRFRTNDNSCTVPAIPAGGQLFQGNGAFGQLAYTGDAADDGPTDIGRMSEGYVVIHMMGTADPDADDSEYAAAAVHNANGVPADCASLEKAFANGSDFIELKNEFGYEGNPLKGSFNLVNGARGQTAGGDAVTLANFWAPPNGADNLITMQLPPAEVPAGVVTAFDQFDNTFQASFHEPTLHSANTPGQVHMPDGTVAETPDGLVPSGADLVTFVLTRDNVINQWAARPGTATTWEVDSDWVVTFPTKRYYVDADTHEFSGRATGRADLPAGGGGRPALPYPFTANFAGTSPNARSCDRVGFVIYDREEFEITRVDGPVFSPAPSPDRNELCTEVNVITFGASDGGILASGPGITGNVPASDLPGVNGWMRLELANDANQGYGLPVVGFSLTARVHADVGLSDAFLVDHAYTRCGTFGGVDPICNGD